MSGFIQWLEKLNKENTKMRAILRRGLAFEAGQYVPAYPYVEPFVRDEDHSWRREMHYLVAGLWAAHWREERSGKPVPIGKACQALYIAKDQSPSIENRFIHLLDSDESQLSHRIRQMLALLKEYPIDFDTLLTGLLYWNNDQKRTQNAWARDFYRSTQNETEPEQPNQEEQPV